VVLLVGIEEGRLDWTDEGEEDREFVGLVDDALLGPLLSMMVGISVGTALGNEKGRFDGSSKGFMDDVSIVGIVVSENLVG
jgi:hypothetical protein